MPEQAAAPGPPEADPQFLAVLAAEARFSGGALPFGRFMELALYHPGFGYYTRGRQRVGRGGDFVTSVSVGRCFGKLLARHLAPVLERMAAAGGGELSVVEVGAEGGELAADLTAELGALLADGVSERIRYVAVEPFEPKREPLRRRLAGLPVGSGQVVAGWGDLRAARGVLVANEVLDAMPVRRFRSDGRGWSEVCVAVGGGACREVLRPAGDGVAGALPAGLAEGFTVELNTGLPPWFEGLSGGFEELYGLFIDYGLERTEMFYEPGRAGGTLRAYAGHRLLDDPLRAPGQIDLTAHVDFERVAAAAASAGLRAGPLVDQHRFLIEAARPWLLEVEARGAPPDAETAKLLRQFQTLSHPRAMGAAFKILPVEKRAGGVARAS